MSLVTYFQMIVVISIAAASAFCISHSPFPIDTAGISTRQSLTPEETPAIFVLLDGLKPQEIEDATIASR